MAKKSADTSRSTGRVQLAYLHAQEVAHSWHASLLNLIVWDLSHGTRVSGLPLMMRTDAVGLASGEARNGIVEQFLDKSAHEWLFFIDTDMGFDADALDRLLAAADPVTRPVLGGLCFALRETRHDGMGGRRVMPVPTMYRWAKTAGGHIGFTTQFVVPKDEVVQVAGTGAAFLLVHRSALEKVRAEYGDSWFAPVRYGDGRQVSEDLSFCWRLHTIGVPVHVHTGVTTTHLKQFWVGAADYAPPREFIDAAERALQAEVFAGPAHDDRPTDHLTPLVVAEQEVPVVTPNPLVSSGEARISILCPTRGRPDNMVRLVESCDRNAAGSVEFVFYLDEDDELSIERARELSVARGGGVTAVTGPRIVLSEMWNECANYARADVMMHAGDDIVFRTPRWDQLVLDTFDRYPDKIVFVHGDDRLQGANLGTHGFLHRRWVDTVGHFVPPYFSSDYNDTWLTDVADRLGRRVYLPELVTEHLHPLAGKAEWDATHQDRLERGERDQVGELYRLLESERLEDAAKLQDAIDAAVPA